MKSFPKYFLVILILLCGSWLVLSPQVIHAEDQVQDQQQILTTTDIQAIHHLNQHLAHLKHPQQIWVRTYQNLPEDWKNYSTKELKQMYRDKSDLSDYRDEELTATLPKVREIDPDDYNDDEAADAAQKRADRQEKLNEHVADQVNIIVVYKMGTHNCVAFIGNDTVPLGDFQLWYLHWLAPRNIKYSQQLLRVLRRYDNFIQRHAIYNYLQPINWGNLMDLWLYAIMVWLVMLMIKGIRSSSGDYFDDDDHYSGDRFSEGYLYGYWQRDLYQHHSNQGDDSNWEN